MAEDEAIEDYRSSLAELKFNSKPLINMLTMLAEDNAQKAQQIVQVVENHILQVEANRKLPVLYLIDSICKNLPDTTYRELFAQSIITIFAKVFEEVDEKTRQSMYKLRGTWTTIFPNKKLYGIDVRVQMIDPAWPMTAQEPEQLSIHVNPKFLVQPNVEEVEVVDEKSVETEAQMRKKLIAKQQELLKLQQQRLEMEQAEIARMEQEQKKSEISRAKATIPASTVSLTSNRPSSSIHINPAVHAPNPQVWNVQNSVEFNQTTEVKISRDPRVRDPRRANRDPRIQQQTNVPIQQQVIQPQFATSSTSLVPQTALVISESSLPSQTVSSSQPTSNIQSALVQQLVSSHPTVMLPPHSSTALLESADSQTTQLQQTQIKDRLIQHPSIQPQLIQPQQLSELHCHVPSGQQSTVSGQPATGHPFTSQLSPETKLSPSAQHSHNVQQTTPNKTLQSVDISPHMVSPTLQQPPVVHTDTPFVQPQQVNQISTAQVSPQSKALLQNPGEPVPPPFLQQFAHKPAPHILAQQPGQCLPDVTTSRKEPLKEEISNRLIQEIDENKNSEAEHKILKECSLGKLGRIPKISDRDKKSQNSISSNKLIKEDRRDRRNESRSASKAKGDLDSDRFRDSEKSRDRDRKPERLSDNSRRIREFGRTDRNDRPSRQPDRKNEDRRERDHKSQSRHDSRDNWQRGLWERERSPRNRSPDRRKRDPDSRSPRKSSEVESKARDESKTSGRSRNLPSKNSHTRERRSADRKVTSDPRQKDREAPSNKSELDKVGGIKNELDSKSKDNLDVDIRSEKENKLKRKSNSEHSDRSEKVDSRPAKAIDDETNDKTEVIDMDLEVDQDDRISDVNPSTKRLKLDDEVKPKTVAAADISELIGGEDQDYRRPLPQPKKELDSPQDTDERMLSPDKPGHVGWSSFKQAHPEDFSYEIEHQRRELNIPQKEPLQENRRFENGPVSDNFERKIIQDQFNSEMQRRGLEEGLKDAYAPKREFGDTDYRRQPTDIMHSTPHNKPDKIKSVLELGPADFGNAMKRFESTPIPKDLSLRKREVVLEEAAKRLRNGEITHEQHQDILKQLSEVYIIQKTLHRRSLDKEFMKMESAFPDENAQNISPERKRLPNVTSHDDKHAVEMQKIPNEQQRMQPVDRNLNRTRDTGNNVSFDEMPFHDEDRLNFITGMWGTDQSEEIVIDRIPYEIGLGGKPRKVTIDNSLHELFADAEKRCIFFNKRKVYTFNNPMATVNVKGKKYSLFYHGRPKFLWISGEQYEIRLDAPPRRVNINNKEHSIYINGQTEMISIDRVEMGPFGGPPRDIVIENNKHVLSFEAPPRNIIIDGKDCKLNLSSKIPVVIIEGIPHGIRFDGPPVDLMIDDQKYTIPVNHPARIKLGRRSHKILLGGPAHEIVLGGKWFELKFEGPPKKIFFGNKVYVFQLISPLPDVKILGEVPYEIISRENDPRRNRLQYRGGVDNGMRQVMNRDTQQQRFEHNQMVSAGPRPSLGPVPHQIGPDQPQTGPRPQVTGHGPQQIGPGSQQIGPRPQQMGPGPQPIGPGPRQMAPGPQPTVHEAQQIRPGPRQIRLGPQQIALVPQPMGPAPQPMGPGPQPVMPGPQQIGPGLQQTGSVPQMGPVPNQMGQVVQQMGSEIQQLRPGFQQPGGNQTFVPNMQQNGPGPQHMGQGTPQMGPGPKQMGQGPLQMAGGQFIHQQAQTSVGIGDPRFGGLQPLQNQPGDPRFSAPGQMPQQGPMNMPQQRLMGPMNVGSGQLMANTQALPLQGPGIPLQNQQVPQNMMNPAAQPGSGLPPQLDINALFQKLVSAGIIDSTKPQEEEKSSKDTENEEEGDGEAVIEHVPDISGLELYKLKKQYNGVIQRLYTGIQCSSCGVRFLLEDTEEYREHLDWHFRQNKRNEGSGVSKFQSWHYSINEWIQYEEIGSVEERSQSVFFESQKTVQQQPTYTATILDSSNVIKNPPATGDDTCEICGEPFDQYWDEDEEEWHLKEAIRVEDKTYHPICYEDVKDGSIIETPSPTIEPSKPLQTEIKKEKKEPEENKEDMGKKIQDQIKKELGMLDNPLQTLLNLAKEKKS